MPDPRQDQSAELAEALRLMLRRVEEAQTPSLTGESRAERDADIQAARAALAGWEASRR